MTKESEVAENKNEIELTVVADGVDYEVDANVNAPLRTVMLKAIETANKTGQPPERWQLKTEDNSVLDLDKKVGEYSFAPGATLFLSLKAGAGG